LIKASEKTHNAELNTARTRVKSPSKVLNIMAKKFGAKEDIYESSISHSSSGEETKEKEEEKKEGQDPEVDEMIQEFNELTEHQRNID
jgi:hypothetical protein